MYANRPKLEVSSKLCKLVNLYLELCKWGVLHSSQKMVAESHRHPFAIKQGSATTWSGICPTRWGSATVYGISFTQESGPKRLLKPIATRWPLIRAQTGFGNRLLHHLTEESGRKRLLNPIAAVCPRFILKQGSATALRGICHTRWGSATVSCAILGGRAAEAVAESDWRVRQLDGGGMPPKNAVNTVAEPDWPLFETIWMQLGVKLETEWNVGNNHVTFNRKKSGRSRNNCNATWLHCVIKLVCR